MDSAQKDGGSRASVSRIVEAPSQNSEDLACRKQLVELLEVSDELELADIRETLMARLLPHSAPLPSGLVLPPECNLWPQLPSESPISPFDTHLRDHGPHVLVVIRRRLLGSGPLLRCSPSSAFGPLPEERVNLMSWQIIGVRRQPGYFKQAVRLHTARRHSTLGQGLGLWAVRCSQEISNSGSSLGVLWEV